jgi:nucleotide sugar dehydrogenase
MSIKINGEKMKIGIIGQGFVGSAIREGLKNFYEVKGYDLDSSKCFNMGDTNHQDRLAELVDVSDIVFVCVPTPMRKDGSCDIRILQNAIDSAYAFIVEQNPDPKHADFLNMQGLKKTFVIKSTVPPGTTEKLSFQYPRINLCFSPEFLTEANSYDDFKNQTRIVIGGAGAKTIKVMFRKVFPSIPIVITRSDTAEMVKYFINCFLASKVIFANQMYKICQAADIDYDKVCEYALYDERIGKSHLAVPGPDGDFGFGGHCFPKDLAAMVTFGNDLKVKTGFLDEIEVCNDYYRSNKDWEQMKGRAVSDD